MSQYIEKMTEYESAIEEDIYVMLRNYSTFRRSIAKWSYGRRSSDT
jgi:hypothetical protein